MIDVTTQDLVTTLVVKAKATQRAEDILALSKTAQHAAKLKKAQREERAALTALNRHFKDCIKEVKHNHFNLTTLTAQQSKDLSEWFKKQVRMGKIRGLDR